MSINHSDKDDSFGARWHFCGLPVLLMLWLALWLPPAVAAGSIEIIVNADHADTALDRSLLRAIFAMRLRQWPGGMPVHVFVFSDHDELTELFCREQLGTYPYVMRTTWDRMVFTGTGLAPTVVRSEQEMRERVRSTPGAIGYVRSAGVLNLVLAWPEGAVAMLQGTSRD